MPFDEYDEYLAYIQEDDTRDAFRLMVHASTTLAGYHCRPNPRQTVPRNYWYFNSEGIKDFAFRVCQRWLAFYLGRPQITHPQLTLEKLMEAFPDARKIGTEFTFAIRSVKDAYRALEIAFGQPSLDALTAPRYGDDESLMEGSVRSVLLTRIERNPEARRRCIEHYGYLCTVCKVDLELVYGAIGREFIHVHHLTPLHLARMAHEVDPVKDLRPVCPNCHAMLHRYSVPLTIDELMDFMTKARA